MDNKIKSLWLPYQNEDIVQDAAVNVRLRGLKHFVFPDSSYARSVKHLGSPTAYAARAGGMMGR